MYVSLRCALSETDCRTRWYKRSESQKRYSFFFCSTTLAGAFGGLLASAIGKMDGMRGYHGWRWVFILGRLILVHVYWCAEIEFVEGTLTAVVGIIFFFLISDFPEEAKWLTPEERSFVKARLLEDVGDSQRHTSVRPRDVVLSILRECE